MVNQRSSGPLEEFTRRPVLRLAVSCPDLPAARLFYVGTLGCGVLSETADALVIDFFTCRLYVHRGPGAPPAGEAGTPMEFGLETGWEDWHRAVDHLNYVGVRYASPPSIRERGTPREAAHFSIADPGGNLLGFTAWRHPERSEK